MMLKGDIKEILEQITYKPGWEFNLDDKLNLQVRFFADGEIQKGRKWQISIYSCKSEVVQTCMKAILACEEHETREKFKYRGRSIFGPHFDVDALVEICDQERIDCRK